MNPRDPALGSPPLPDWVKGFRPHQEVAINDIVKSFKSGAKVVFLDAPTGAGKTLIAETVRRMTEMRAAYLCTTKSLQDQFLHDYPYAKLIKGRANYPTRDRPELFERAGARAISAADCDRRKEKTPVRGCGGCDLGPASLEPGEFDEQGLRDSSHCSFCHPVEECPYTIAKLAALQSRLAVANTSYFLYEANYVSQFGEKNMEHPLVIIDEADRLEDELMRFIEFSLSRRWLKKLNLPQPKHKTKSDAWRQWIYTWAIPALKERKAALNPEKSIQDRREYQVITGKLNRLDEIKEDVGEGWVYTGYEAGNVVLKPVTVAEEAKNYLWKHGRKFLLMSATIISPSQMAEDLGLEDHEWDSVRVSSSFPVENRPIYVRGVTPMSAKNKETSWPKMAKAVGEIIDQYPNDRILVHTVSYDLTAYLSERLDPNRVLSYQNPKEREVQLELYRTQPNAVLLAPSFDRGIDLPDDQCRVIIVTKVPFPYLGDKQVNARRYAKGGSGWYAMQTIRSLVQMTGRGVRHENDHAESYILDSQFLLNIWRRNRGMVPEWWKEALRWEY